MLASRRGLKSTYRGGAQSLLALEGLRTLCSFFSCYVAQVDEILKGLFLPASLY